MTDPRCEAIRISLEAGETEGTSDHLAGCESCRTEAERIQLLTARLAGDARIEPPAALDAHVRAILAHEPFSVSLRPWLAGGLAVASFAGLVATLAIVLSYTPVAEYGPLLALAVGTAYLALSTAASVPLLLHAFQTTNNPRTAEVRV